MSCNGISTLTLGAELLEGHGPGPGTLAAVVSPSLANGAAAPVPLVESGHGLGAAAEAVVEVAGLGSVVHASGARGIQREACARVESVS